MDKQHAKEKIAAVAFLFCIAVVSVWLVMAARSRAGFDSFGLTGEQLRDFQPVSSAWYAERARLVTDDPTEPNIIAHQFRLRYPQNTLERQPVFVRLVHGYNMCDCMRIKGYDVELLRDDRQRTTDDGPPTSGSNRESVSRSSDHAPGVTSPASSPTFPISHIAHPGSRISNSTSLIPDPASSPVSSPATHILRSSPTSVLRPPSSGIPPHQLWRLTSSTGDMSIWAITMIRATDFTPTDTDTRDMAFPRVGVPDAQGWAPRGLSVKSLRHPIQNGRRFLRAKWNASRCDLLTFLGLRQPAWASDEVLALISAVSVRGAATEEEIARHVLNAHASMADQYQAWRQSGE